MINIDGISWDEPWLLMAFRHHFVSDRRQEEGDPIVPRDNPEFLAMEADLKDRKKKQFDKAKTAEKCRQRGNQCMTEGHCFYFSMF
jgi:hypothetical protein